MKATSFALSFFILTLAGWNVHAQDFKKHGWSQATLDKANTAANTGFLSEEEKNVILYTNLARIKPDKFAGTIKPIWEAYSDNKYGEIDDLNNNKWFQSLLEDLKEMEPAPLLYPHKQLYKAARYHAKDMGKTGKTGHTSSDGTSFVKRVTSYADSIPLSENCSYGYNKGFDIVMQFLVDENVKSLAHRVNSLNPKYTKVGVSIQPHEKYNYNCVMDFGGEKP